MSRKDQRNVLICEMALRKHAGLWFIRPGCHRSWLGSQYGAPCQTDRVRPIWPSPAMIRIRDNLGQNERIFLHQCDSQIIHFSYSKTLSSSEIDMYYIYLMLILFIPVKNNNNNNKNTALERQFLSDNSNTCNHNYIELISGLVKWTVQNRSSITSNPIIVLKDAYYFFLKKLQYLIFDYTFYLSTWLLLEGAPSLLLLEMLPILRARRIVEFTCFLNMALSVKRFANIFLSSSSVDLKLSSGAVILSSSNNCCA